MKTLAALAAMVAFSGFAADKVEKIKAVRTVPHELDVLVKTGHIQGAACSEGFAQVPKSVSKRDTPVFFTVRALGGNMQGWRKDPTNNPPRIEFRFHEYRNGKFADITK